MINLDDLKREVVPLVVQLQSVRDGVEFIRLGKIWNTGQEMLSRCDAIIATLDSIIAEQVDGRTIDWDGLYKIRKTATGKILDQLNLWLYENDTRKTGDNSEIPKGEK